jgi:hemolysin activation/secretion protein
MRSPDHPSANKSLSSWTASVLVMITLTQPLPAQPAAPSQEGPVFYVREYRVAGSTKLPALKIEETVYPFLGPARTAEDVEKARLALEAEYRAAGYKTVSVLIPQQDPRFGVIRLEVAEGTVGRVRVNGAKWILPIRIKAGAPSLAEGSVPNFTDTEKEILALNRRAKVTPSMRPGIDPGTIDIDLNVEDELPLHGSLELNNRYSVGTTKLRLNGALSYGNVFQRGDTIGGSFQVAPENPDDALVYSGYYLSRINDHLSLMLQGSKQDSDVATLGGASATIGRGTTFGLRALLDLPSTAAFYQNFTLGIDWKRLDEVTYFFGNTSNSLTAPIEYFPLSASYAATHVGKGNFTEINLTATLGLRGLGDNYAAYANKRYKADGNFFYLRGDVSHTRDLAGGMQLFGKLQGQLASGPLINSEQFSGGGLGSVRGYLEASALGDNGLFATFEVRGPSFTGVEDKDGKRADEWRIHAFLDGGVLGIYDALPGQESTTTFASIGVGTRFKFKEHYNGSVDLAFPLLDQATTDAFDPFLSLRGWADF